MITDAVGRIREATAVGAAGDLIASYFDPGGPFAGSTFHDLPPNNPADLHPADLLATSLLDVSFKPRATRQLLVEREPVEFFEWLRPDLTPVDLELGTVEGVSGSWYDAATRSWEVLQDLEGVGPVVAGKLMARKRPGLIPIVDDVVVAIVAAPPHEYWRVYHEALSDGEVRDKLQDLGRRAAARVPPLRLLDALLWMLGSNSENAQAARLRAGMPIEPWRPGR